MNTSTRWTSGFLMAALLVGLISVPGLSQNDSADSSSDQEAVNLLKSAAKKTLNSGSYTMDMDQTVKQKQSMSNMTVTQTSTGSVKFEKPYMYMNMTSELSGMRGKGKGQAETQELLGKQDEDNELVALYEKSGQSWNKLDSTKSVSFKKMFNRFRDPDQLSKQLKNVQFDGEETVNGHDCQKISAVQKEEAIEDAAKEMMKGASKNKMVQNMDLSVSVEESDMTVWVRKDSSLMEKVDVKTKQTVSMSMKVGGNERSFDMEMDMDMTSNFKDYDSTSIPQKYKDKLEDLISQNK